MALLLLACFCLACRLPAAVKHAVPPNRPLPPFSLPDTEGHLHRFVQSEGKPAALFFFCGCRPCHDCARLWGQVQQNGDLGGDKRRSSVIVFSGPAADARKFAADTGLDPAQTLLLLDPDDRVTEAYGVRQCPRVFVAGPQGRLAYTSPDTNGPAPRLSAPALVSRVLTVWRSFSPLTSAVSVPARVLPSREMPHLEFAALPSSDSPLPGTLHLNAGQVDVDRLSRWTRTFTLKNPTSEPLTIADLRGSCGCESLLLTRGGVAAPRLRLAPGETAEVKLDVTLAANQFGPVRKYVWVYGPSTKSTAPEALATLQLDMTLVQSVRFVPESLHFGKIASGAGAALPLIVTADADLLTNGVLPPLLCASPALRAVPSGPLQTTTQEGRAALRQAYTVQLLSSAPAGSVEGELRFAPPAGSPPDTAPLSRPAVPVTGQIAGTLDALPASVFFGSLPAGRSAVRTVVLSLAAPAAVQSLAVRTSAPWLLAGLDLSANAPAKHHLLTITLSATAPLGPVQGTVTVSLGSGSQISILVIAELTK